MLKERSRRLQLHSTFAITKEILKWILTSMQHVSAWLKWGGKRFRHCPFTRAFGENSPDCLARREGYIKHLDCKVHWLHVRTPAGIGITYHEHIDLFHNGGWTLEKSFVSSRFARENIFPGIFVRSTCDKSKWRPNKTFFRCNANKPF